MIDQAAGGRKIGAFAGPQSASSYRRSNRVMHFANVPAGATTLAHNRLFVERGGKAHCGHRDKLRVGCSVRLNAEGMNVLPGQLNPTR